jgi:DNA-directed RNA polymerase specialized sigma24 family protein
LSKRILTVKTMTALAIRTIQKTETSTILRRVAEKDKTAVKECIDAYGNFIWALARKLTASREEAEAATKEIFIDIWRSCEERARNTQSIEKKLIAMIALRRLIRPLKYAKQTSMANIDAPNEQGAGMDRISESI